MLLPYCQPILHPKLKQTAEAEKFVRQIARLAYIVVHKGEIEAKGDDGGIHEEYVNKALRKAVFVKLEPSVQVVYYRHTAENHLPVEVCGISYAVAAFPYGEDYYKGADNANRRQKQRGNESLSFVRCLEGKGGTSGEPQTWLKKDYPYLLVERG